MAVVEWPICLRHLSLFTQPSISNSDLRQQNTLRAHSRRTHLPSPLSPSRSCLCCLLSRLTSSRLSHACNFPFSRHTTQSRTDCRHRLSPQQPRQALVSLPPTTRPFLDLALQLPPPASPLGEIDTLLLSEGPSLALCSSPPPTLNVGLTRPLAALAPGPFCSAAIACFLAFTVSRLAGSCAWQLHPFDFLSCSFWAVSGPSRMTVWSGAGAQQLIGRRRGSSHY